MIEVGDTIYILHEDNDWQLTQRTMTVTEITSWPSYPKGRVKAYQGLTSLGKPDCTPHSHHIWNEGKRRSILRPIVRKTPYPDVPFEERR